MKRLLTVLIPLLMLVFVCACSKIDLDVNADVRLNFVYGEENISVILEETEAKRVIGILNENVYSSVFSGVPSCGFDANISLVVDGKTFAIARDTCNWIQNIGNLRYFDLSQEDMAYIRSLFEKYGGYFPCV